jgi:bacterial/archaeal transporter family-2 protein
MSNIYFYIFLALAAGAMMPTQAATNNKMAMVVGSPILSAFISFFVGTVALLVYVLVSGESIGSLMSAKEAPPIAWVGGLLGAFFVTAGVTLVPRLGVATTFSVMIAGQMIVTLVIDHFGLLGIPVKEVSFARVAGIVLIGAGVVLVRKF